MTNTFNRLFATAILSGALALGGGLGVAMAHHGNISEHSTTKGKSLGEIERLERQKTAELNRNQVMPQVAMVQMPAAPAAIPQQQPMPDEMPAAQQPDDQAALPQAEAGDIATAEEDGADATN
jgi:hypothetical protein